MSAMNNGDNGGDEKFLSRWSRLKRDTRVAEPDGAGQTAQADLPGATAPLQRQKKEASAESAPPQLPPVDELTLDSDFRGFFHPKVDEDVKRAALKKLFSDPHFNVMDGLDTYIDDYSKPDPLPVEMLAQMRSAQKIFKWARNELEEGETAPAQLDSPPTPVLEAPVATSEVMVSIEQGGDVPATEPLLETSDTKAPEFENENSPHCRSREGGNP